MAIKFEDAPGPKGKTAEKTPAAPRSPPPEAKAAPEEEPQAASPAKRMTKARKKS